jgi:putative ABC transport system ATP-binding protein
MNEPLLEAIGVEQHLGKGAGQVHALKGVSLELGGGQLTLLMGPSGSGKTTLLSVLGCMLTPTRGTVRVRGHTTAGANPGELAKLRREHIGFIFQAYRLLPMLSALDNVRLALDVRDEHGDRSRVRAQEALRLVGLAHKQTAFPSDMSGGEQQRVAIARAIVGGPAAVLADEPTGALDSENGHAVMRILAEIASDSARGVLVVTHDRRTLRFADRVIHIEDGRIAGDHESCDHAAAVGAFPPRFLDEAEDFEQHRRPVERGDRAVVERWRDHHEVAADEVDTAQAAQQP